MKKLKIIALVSALIAGLSCFQLLREISKPTEIPRTAVVVAAVDIAENTEITAEMVMLSPVANESLLPGCTNDLGSVIGMVMKSDIYVGEQITRNRLVKLGENDDSSTSLSYLVEPGKRAISISVNSLTSVTNMIRPGNHVDIIINYSYTDETKLNTKGEPEEVSVSKYLIEDVVVLAVNQNMSKAGQTEYSTITVQLSPEDTLLLNYADMNYGLRLVLRSPLDEDPNNAEEVGIDQIMEANK